MEQSARFNDIVQEAATLVKQVSKANRGVVPLSPEVAALLESVQPAEKSAAVPVSALREAIPAADSTQWPDGLAEIAGEVAACTKFSLCETRRNTVFGVGNPQAKLVFVGEAPGADEDRKGEPFVGRAGQLLTDIIVKGMKMRREDVFICNVLKCRPPENRDPNPEEVLQCEPYLIRQLEAIRPKVICALGRIAAQTLLKTKESTGRMRGKWHSYHGIPFRVTYHPAYLLRTPEDKGKCWEDVQEIMKLLKGEITPTVDGISTGQGLL